MEVFEVVLLLLALDSLRVAFGFWVVVVWCRSERVGIERPCWRKEPFLAAGLCG